MKTETIAMGNKEIERLHILQRLNEKLLKQNQAAITLGIRARQVLALLKYYRRDGPLPSWSPNVVVKPATEPKTLM